MPVNAGNYRLAPAGMCEDLRQLGASFRNQEDKDMARFLSLCEG